MTILPITSGSPFVVVTVYLWSDYFDVLFLYIACLEKKFNIYASPQV